LTAQAIPPQADAAHQREFLIKAHSTESTPAICTVPISPWEPDYLIEVRKLNNRYLVEKPFFVSLDIDDNGDKIFEIKPLGLYAISDNPIDAIKELSEDVVSLCDNIFDLPESKLGSMPRKWKKILLQHVRRTTQ
jgi:hypothetical protein